ncbi:AEC family transporter [Conyzicola sp.]|uniref:AEC family transporter n=1 Tax=Conyzicola sp. TaxID=1969404 RepID=UPI0039898630
MSGVLVGFAIIGAVILIGYVVGRAGVLGDHAPFVISRMVFFVLSPALLFTVLADADVHQLFSSMLAVSAISAVLSCLLFAGIALLVFRRKLPEAVIGSVSSGYVNANNIGIPVAFYVLGDTALSAPVILLQLLVLTPITLTILDITTSGKTSLRRVIMTPLTNPVIIGSALGVLVSATGVELPAAVMEPFRIVGAAAVPLVLIGFGMSLHGQKLLAPGSGRRDILLASGIKLALMPVIAWVFGRFVFGLDHDQLFAAVVLAGLPTAQNVFVYAQRYDRGVTLARDTVLITTVGSVPVLVLVALLLK